MIRITLYKECILNDKYKNVFSMQQISLIDHSTPFENYLNSLDKQIYEVDNVYQDDMTSLNFKLKNEDYSTIYSFNYMKIQSLDGNIVTLTRYAFINSIKIGNEIAQVSYKIDIWHTFSRRINGLNMSLLNGLRKINDNEYHRMPVNYEGNDKLNFNQLEPVPTGSGVGLVLQIQVYNTKEFGNATSATCQYMYIDTVKYHEKNGDIWIDYSIPLTTSNVETELERIINLSGDKNFIDTDSGVNAYYKIGNVYLVRNTFSAYFVSSDYRIKQHDLPETTIKYWEYYVKLVGADTYPLSLVNTFTIPNNFKIRALGFGSLYFPVEVNGSNIVVSFYTSISKHSFKYIMSCQNKFIDIVDIFEMFPTTTQINGDVLAQQKISRALMNLQEIGNMVKSSASFVSNLFGGNANYIHGENMYGFYESSFLETGKPNLGISAGLKARDTAASGIIGNIFGFAVDAVDRGIRWSARNAPVYNSTGMVKANNIALLNVFLGFGYYTITADNEQYAKDSINNLGYNVYKYTKDISDLTIFTAPSNFISDGVYYNCIRFGHSDVYGQFPLDIAKGLNQILENGIKIWYHHDIDYALEHDTYAVG